MTSARLYFISLVILSISCTKQKSIETRKDGPVTFESLIAAHLGDSVNEYLEGRHKLFYENHATYDSYHYFPVQISGFTGELTYRPELRAFTFKTGGPWEQATKDNFGTALDTYSRDLDYETCLYFIDSIARHHQIVKKDSSNLDLDVLFSLEYLTPCNLSIRYVPKRMTIILGALN